MSPIDMGVDLGGSDVGMTEEILNDSEIGPPLHQMGGETVPEHVRVDALQTDQAGVLSNDLPDRHPLEGPAPTGDQKPVFITPIGETGQ